MADAYITVTALTKYIKKKLDIDPNLKQMYIKGEISNFKHHSRGHMYMTIKDQGAQIRAVMFSSDNKQLKFQPENGMQVLIQGNISVFEAYGQYQLYIQRLEPDGKGALYAAYEQMKDKLDKEGFFDSEYKRDIPSYPRHIAVITSPTGAAVRDMISTLKRRFPITQITVIPVLVQGEKAIPSLLEGLEKANNIQDFDTIIIGRGGGSIEDLWAFNDESVAKAIFHSRIPVISGIGHETDFTISDFTSDLRAPTPTGAAELAVPSIIDIQIRLQQLQASLSRTTTFKLQTLQRSLQKTKQSGALQNPERFLRQKEQHLDRLTEDVEKQTKNIVQRFKYRQDTLSISLAHHNPKKQYEQRKQQVQELKVQMNRNQEQLLNKKKHQLQLSLQQLTLLNPLEIMKRGYSVAYSTDGHIISSIEKLSVGDDVSIQMNDGVAACTIRNVWSDEKNGK